MQANAFLGSNLAGFRITDFIGEGGMALVFRGESLVDPSIVRAIKVIRPEFASRKDFTLRFREEARILERLNHPNIVRFYGVRWDNQYLVMELELLAGRPLSLLFERDGHNRSSAPLDETVRLFGQAAQGIAAAHALGFAHRDLKPENIFVTSERQVKVLDFGVAKALDDADRGTRATTAGTTPGTAAYIAPEVWAGAAPSLTADVYALGLTMFEILAGYHPFTPPGETPKSSPQLMFMHVQTGVPPLRRFRPDAPEALEAILNKATAKEPEARYANAGELAAALAEILPRLGGTAEPPVSADGTQFALPTFGGGARGQRPGAALPTTGNAVSLGSRSGGSKAPLLGFGIAVAAVAIVAGVAYRFVPHEGGESPSASGSAPSASAAPAAGAKGTSLATPLNRWVTVPPGDKIRLGVDDDRNPDPGFRTTRGIMGPAAAFQIQQHEVTWEEVEPFLVKSNVKFARGAGQPAGDAGKHYPASGIGWATAESYCRTLGGMLPTEEQWESAARSTERRPNPWGADVVDLARTNVYAGAEGRLREVMNTDQDRTPGDDTTAIFDLAGNALEWTVDLYRDDAPNKNEEWTQEGGLTFRAVRGLPVNESRPKHLPHVSAAYRTAFCATGSCPPDATKQLAFIGFRCARPDVKSTE